jgi:hypothetical protein
MRDDGGEFDDEDWEFRDPGLANSRGRALGGGRKVNWQSGRLEVRKGSGTCKWLHQYRKRGALVPCQFLHKIVWAPPHLTPLVTQNVASTLEPWWQWILDLKLPYMSGSLSPLLLCEVDAVRTTLLRDFFMKLGANYFHI